MEPRASGICGLDDLPEERILHSALPTVMAP